MARKGGKVRLSSVGRVESFNPYSYKLWPTEGIFRTFSTLMARAEDEIASAYGYLASGVEFSKDGRSFVFYIRPEAVFHDKSPITPKDVIATFEAVNKPSMPQYSSILQGIIKAEKVGGNGVKFTVEEGNSKEKAFLLGTELFILSKKDLEAFPLESSERHLYLGSGPYKLIPPKSLMHIEYKRVPHWWGENLPVNKGKYNFDIISYDFFYSFQSSFQALKAGEIDVRQEYTAERWKRGYDFPAIQKGDIEKVQFMHSNTSDMLGILFNMRNPLFKDIDVREAISLMLDFEWMNKNIFDNSYERLSSFFTGTDFEANKKPSQEELVLLRPYKEQLPESLFKKPFETYKGNGEGCSRYRIKKASKLLRKAGWYMEKGKLTHKKTGKIFKIDILLPSASYARFINSFAKNLKRIGIEANLEVTDKASYKSRVNVQNFDMLAGVLYPLFEIPGNKLDLYWHSRQANKKGTKNLIGVRDSIVDALLEKIKTANTEKALMHAMRALDRVLIHRRYLIPQWKSTEYKIAKSKFIERPNKKLYHGLGLDTWWSSSKN